MVLQEMIRYEPDAVGLKPSARGSEARLRGRDRIHFGKTISRHSSDTNRLGWLYWRMWLACNVCRLGMGDNRLIIIFRFSLCTIAIHQCIMKNHRSLRVSEAEE